PGVGRGTADIAVGDFNGDGAPDLSVVSLNSDDVLIFLNDGQGGFYGPVDMHQLAPGAGGVAVVVADFNQDGNLDLVIGYYNTSPTYGNVTLLLGNGDGTFQEPMDYAGDSGP